MDAIKSSGLHVWCSSYLLVKEISWESWWLCIIQGFPFCLVNLAFNWVNRYYEIYLALCFSPHSLKLISKTYFRYCYLFVFWIFPPPHSSLVDLLIIKGEVFKVQTCNLFFRFLLFCIAFCIRLLLLLHPPATIKALGTWVWLQMTVLMADALPDASPPPFLGLAMQERWRNFTAHLYSLYFLSTVLYWC